jgi:hypothetical protein
MQGICSSNDSSTNSVVDLLYGPMPVTFEFVSCPLAISQFFLRLSLLLSMSIVCAEMLAMTSTRLSLRWDFVASHAVSRDDTIVHLVHGDGHQSRMNEPVFRFFFDRFSSHQSPDSMRAMNFSLLSHINLLLQMKSSHCCRCTTVFPTSFCFLIQPYILHSSCSLAPF